MTLLDGKLQTIMIPPDEPSHSFDGLDFQPFSHLSIAMSFRFSTAVAALGCVLLASCYPYDESRHRRPAPPKQTQKTVTAAEQQKLKEQREQMREKDDLVRKNVPNEPGIESPAKPDGGTVTPPIVEKRADYPVASKVPGKEGYVFSPFNNKLIDVKDMPSGTLVSDPTYPESAKKFFRVP